MQNQLPPSPVNYKVIAIGLIPALIALLAPEDVFERMPWLKSYVELIRHFIPGVSDYSSYSIYPSVTALAFSVAYPLTLIQFLMIHHNFRSSVFYTNKIIDHFISRKFVYGVGTVLAFVAGAIGFFALGKDPGFCSGCVNNSRVGMAFLVLVGGASVGFMATLSIIFLTHIPQIFFNKR